MGVFMRSSVYLKQYEKMDERIEKYFNEELSLTERIQFLQEVDSNETLKKQFADYQNSYALLNLGSQLADPVMGKQKFDCFIRQKQNKNVRRLWLLRFGYVAASLVLVVLSSWLTAWYGQVGKEEMVVAEMNTLYTPAGQRARLVLQDGTEVWLNAQSKLTYPARFTGKERKVTVEGEAFFNVAKDSVKPFIVSALDVDMKVLGTQFNVYCYPETGYVQTSLLEGSVRVFFSNKEKEGILLKPNQQVTAFNGKMLVEPIRLKDHFLWRDGIYAFEDEPLIDILKKLELYYDVKIIVEDTSMFDETYTGKFRQRDSLDDIFKILQQIRSFKIKKDTVNNIITLSK